MTSGAALVRVLLSAGGAIVSLLAVAAWVMARPRLRAARIGLASVAAGYAVLGLYPLPHHVASILARPFRPLTTADVPPGRVTIVLLGSGNYTQENWAGDRLSVLDPVGAERALEALRVFRLLDAVWVISSGGSVDADDPDLPGATIMAQPSGSETCFRSPVRRLTESNAWSRRSATTVPVRAF